MLRPMVIAAVLVTAPLFPVVAQTASRVPQAMTDDAVIVRERAVWDALARNDSIKALALIGADVPFVIFRAAGASVTTTTEVVRSITSRCTTTRSQLDSLRVVRPSAAVTILAYRSELSRDCGTRPFTNVNHVETVWAVRDGRWVAVGQNFAEVKAP